MADSATPSGEPDSKPKPRMPLALATGAKLTRALRRWLTGTDADQSLRAQIEEAIEEHEEGAATSPPASGDLSPIERLMLRNLLHFSENDADDVAIPRGEIIAISASANWEDVVAAFAKHGHSRLPVYLETLDEVIGMMLMKDVFSVLASAKPVPKDWASLMRQPLFVPQARSALDVLADMRASRIHLAVVVDEYSGTDGIITFEDLVEEIVGEVEDEHDDAPIELLRPLDGGAWDADARVELDDVATRIDPRLADDTESVDTLGGLAFLLAEAVPSVGQILVHPSGWQLEITAGNARHVTRLRLHPPLSPASPQEN
ncbi:MAG: hypothetical protein RLY97_450 [Pseudomonadota bacterium]